MSNRTKKFNLVLFSTTQWSSSSSENLERLVRSVLTNSVSVGSTVSISHYLLVQKWTESCRSRPVFPDFVIPFFTDKSLSLSEARNFLIREFQSKSVSAVSSDFIFAFPDDDAWYTPGFISAIVNNFDCATSCHNISDEPLIFICNYSSKPISADCINIEFSLSKNLLRYSRAASSNTIFLCTSGSFTLPFFDERLGVGSPINGGEDLDYALRLLSSSGKYFYDNRSLVGHRDKVRGKVTGYYPGSLFACRKYFDKSLHFAFLYLYKLLVGVFHVILLRLPFAVYFKSIFRQS